jgi:hypothetical protein
VANYQKYFFLKKTFAHHKVLFSFAVYISDIENRNTSCFQYTNTSLCLCWYKNFINRTLQKFLENGLASLQNL